MGRGAGLLRAWPRGDARERGGCWGAPPSPAQGVRGERMGAGCLWTRHRGFRIQPWCPGRAVVSEAEHQRGSKRLRGKKKTNQKSLQSQTDASPHTAQPRNIWVKRGLAAARGGAAGPQQQAPMMPTHLSLPHTMPSEVLHTNESPAALPPWALQPRSLLLPATGAASSSSTANPMAKRIPPS